MEIAGGVHLHFIKADKFKTNHITCRFSGDLTRVNRARRALVAQMLATANASYPTSRLFRKRLAELYGAQLSTRISTKGLVHMIDFDLSLVGNGFALAGEDLLAQALDFLRESLQNPLRTVEQYQNQVFEVEKANLINYLEADREDVFYHSDLALEGLYFGEDYLAQSPYGRPEEVAQENSYTAFQEFRRLLREDRIDLFVVGQFDEYKILQTIHQFNFQDRSPQLIYQHEEPLTNITREALEARPINQSVLNLAYHVPPVYGTADYLPLLLVNGLLGVFSHSLLFTQLREKEGLAYTVSSQLDPFRCLLKIQAGIDGKERQRAMQVINKQLALLKSGRFSSDLVKKTKTMLVNGVALSRDSHKALVELAYNQSVFGQDVKTVADFEEAMAKVSKKDLIRLANQIKLQAVYMVEGEEA